MWGSVQGVKRGLSQKGQGLRELLGEDTREGLPLPQERSEAAPSWARREGDNLGRGRGFLFSCCSSPREAAWTRDTGGRRNISSQALESETAQGRDFLLGKDSLSPFKKEKKKGKGSPARAFKVSCFSLFLYCCSDFKMNCVTKSFDLVSRIECQKKGLFRSFSRDNV